MQIFFFLIKKVLIEASSLQDLSSLTRDQIQAHGSSES